MFKNKYVPLSIAAIQPDQPLLFPVYDQQGTLLAEKGLTLTESQIDLLISSRKIYTLNRALESAESPDKDDKKTDGILRLQPPLIRLKELETILHDVYDKPNEKTSLSKTLTCVNRLQNICEKSPNAAIAKIITDNNDNYTIRHVLHTAILCELTALHLKWPLEKRRNMLGAALTMNLSTGFMQDELVNQAQPLTQLQQKAIQNHPIDSTVMLQEMGVQNTQWLEYVSKHHESIDGTGYPNGVHQENIPMGALLISLSDIYCAKVSGRNYREPIYANIATRDIFLEKDNTEKGTLIEIFIKILGLYPPGCFVRLKSRELGIVIKRGERIDTPQVKIISEKSSDPLERNIKRQTSDKNYAVKEIVPTRSIKFNLDYNKIWPN
jgi:HD-GYP domain-containing protein (c-di-GMP phosphodiesterase class II)